MIATFRVAKRGLRVGGIERPIGELVPEAHTWRILESYLRQRHIVETEVDEELLDAAIEMYCPQLRERIESALAPTVHPSKTPKPSAILAAARPPAPKVTRRRTPAKKAAAKRGTRKAAAKKVTARKAAAKKAPARKTPTKTVLTVGAPVPVED